MSDTLDIPEPDRLEGVPHPRHAPGLVGHGRAWGEAEAALSGQMPHAWLIAGPEGVGKATFAWTFARRLLEAESDPGLAGRIAALSEPRLALVRRAWDDRAKRLKTQITVEEVRKLRGFLGMSSSGGGRRVVIVDPADEMNPSAANAVLKLLEEPPAGAVFLVITHSPSRLLPTIRSRCRLLRLDPLGSEEIGEALQGLGLPVSDRAPAVAALANGSVRRAVGLIQQDGLALYDELVSLLSTAPQIDRPAALALANSTTGRAGETRRALLLGLIETLLSRLALTGAGRPPDPAVSQAEGEMLARLAPFPAAGLAWAELSQTVSDRAAHALGVNLDPSGLILDILLKINETAGRVARP